MIEKLKNDDTAKPKVESRHSMDGGVWQFFMFMVFSALPAILCIGSLVYVQDQDMKNTSTLFEGELKVYDSAVDNINDWNAADGSYRLARENWKAIFLITSKHGNNLPETIEQTIFIDPIMDLTLKPLQGHCYQGIYYAIYTVKRELEGYVLKGMDEIACTGQ